MIGRRLSELDLAQLDVLCDERQVQRRQANRDKVNSKLNEIARSVGPSFDEMQIMERPYGVVHEGEAYDIWALILDHVTDHSEIRKLREVSTMFRSILHRKYVEASLPVVVKLIRDKRPDYFPSPEGREEAGGFAVDIWAKIVAKFSIHLNLRMVSTQCKRSVEDIFPTEKINLICPATRIWSTEKVARITGILRGNPTRAYSFFPDYVYVHDIHVRDGLQRFHAEITSFLQLVGHRISNFTYISYLETQVEVYGRIRGWAMLMPNLKRLRLERDVVPSDDEPNPLLEEVEPFPTLSQLQCFEDTSWALSARPVQCILEVCSGIRELRLLEIEDAIRDHSTQILSALDNLTSLQMFPSLSLMMHHHLTWKLNKLIVHRENFLTAGDGGRMDEWYVNLPDVPSSRLFMFLKQFGQTLEHLELETIHVIDCGTFLELPSLKTLRMELHESFENLNFLLFAERLEILFVEIGDNCMGNLPPNEKFDRILRESFLGRSIWDVLPSLKWIKLSAEDITEWIGRVKGNQPPEEVYLRL